MKNIDHLIQSISADKPAGDDGRQLVPGIQRTVDDLRIIVENASKRGEEPEWNEIKEQSEKILVKVSKSLDAAFLWTVASVQIDGLDGLEAGIRLLHVLLAKYWETLHPVPDAGDPYERVNILAELSLTSPAFSGPYRILYRLSLCPLLGQAGESGPMIGQVLMAQNPEAWPLGATGVTVQEITAAVEVLSGEYLQQRRDLVESALRSLQAIRDTFRKHAPLANLNDLQATENVLSALRSMLRPRAPDPGTQIPKQGPAVGASERSKALSALTVVQTFLRQHEPASPLVLLIDIAHEIKSCSFFDAMKRLPPSDLDALEKVFGVDSSQSLQEGPPMTDTAGWSAPISSRQQVMDVLSAIDRALSAVDPSSPVLAVIRLSRAVYSRSYRETCGRFEGSSPDNVLEILRRKKESASDKQKN